ncbi:hypothetical protein CERSUDRAFT_81390 [Gelatoporia subvermispora B]|uniref:Uncharacterized protein n=1 Tax=Ceriporiopsis subvermispora (strain B) TaxID=914234 RepID=M2QSU6_CERS8|nr:hypothetical protein CERSUDRAFT_81390 [Gelatoporia subvermispora B]
MADTAGSRILIVSSTTEQARQFVQRVKALSTPDVPELPQADQSSNQIPWTISNKYYTAEVHFEYHAFSEFGARHAVGVPAVIYTWAAGEPCRDHIIDIAKSIEYYDPEISLAVRFGNESAEEDEGLDEFLSSHGFEFVDGNRETLPDRDDFAHDDSGIPGLSRVIDALSTVMWPTIVQSESTLRRKSRARELLDWAKQEEVDDGLRALIASDSTASVSGGDALVAGEVKKSRMQREMEELEKWLEEEDSRRAADDAQAWTAVELQTPVMPTPTIRTPIGDADESFTGVGFDDDFNDFVSAPAPHSSANLDASPRRLVPTHTGASYRSLASTSDIGSDAHIPSPRLKDGSHTEDDPELPSQAEIAEASRRIFGPAGPIREWDSPRSTAGSFTQGSATGDEHHVFEHLDDDDAYEMSAFDLSRVLTALQGMKEEIAGMEDDAERRKAAARVALGLVYGLQAQDEKEEDTSAQSR